MPGERTPSARDIDWGVIIQEALDAPGNMGDTYSRFYRYSYLNQVYLMAQGVREPVATYDRWKALGCQVKPGFKKKEIIRPYTVQRKDDDGEVIERFTRFRSVKCIIPFSQTTGPDLPPPPPSQWDESRALQALNVQQVPFEDIDGNMQGYSVNRNVAINPMARCPRKTLVHELGHVLLGHTTAEAVAQYREHRGIWEFQAEATAYLTMKELEQLDEETATRSRGYIQSWLKGERPPDKAIREVFKVTDMILKAGQLAVDPALQDEV